MTNLKVVPPPADVESDVDRVRRQLVEASVPKEPSPEEKARRLEVAVLRLASQSECERVFWLKERAAEHGVSVQQLTTLVNKLVAQRQKEARELKVETKQKETRAEKVKVTTERERVRDKKEAARECEKGFKALLGLPSAELDARIAEMAARFGRDVETLRAEFDVFAGKRDHDPGHVEPWPDPVEARALLLELQAQLRRFVALDDSAALAITLWTMFAWAHEIASHSPLLILSSPDPDCGKTTCLGVIGKMTPRPQSAVEMTGPGLFRLVDYLHPTLLIDEADKLFVRKPDLLHIVNQGWTYGTKIPRVDRNGIVHWFDPFCAKAIAMVGMSMPPTTASRGIIIKMWPKLPGEKVENFSFSDDATFETLRRKCARWAADNMLKLKDARPALPEGFNNRLETNWKILFAIAEQAGALKEAHRAAIKLSPRTNYKRSEGNRLLEAMSEAFRTRKEITSADLIKVLLADPDGEWGAFRERGPITQRQVAALLKNYEIWPTTLHPTKRSDLSLHGYRRNQFDDAFARFLPPDPHIRTLPPKTKGKK